MTYEFQEPKHPTPQCNAYDFVLFFHVLTAFIAAFLRLPVEIGAQILGEVGEGGLAALAKTCKTLHFHCEEWRYRHLATSSRSALVSLRTGLAVSTVDRKGLTRGQRVQALTIRLQENDLFQPDVHFFIRDIFRCSPLLRELDMTLDAPTWAIRWLQPPSISLEDCAAHCLHATGSTIRLLRSPAANLTSLSIDVALWDGDVYESLSTTFEGVLRRLRLVRQISSSFRAQSPLRVCAQFTELRSVDYLEVVDVIVGVSIFPVRLLDHHSHKLF